MVKFVARFQFSPQKYSDWCLVKHTQNTSLIFHIFDSLTEPFSTAVSVILEMRKCNFCCQDFFESIQEPTFTENRKLGSMLVTQIRKQTDQGRRGSFSESTPVPGVKAKSQVKLFCCISVTEIHGELITCEVHAKFQHFACEVLKF